MVKEQKLRTWPGWPYGQPYGAYEAFDRMDCMVLSTPQPVGSQFVPNKENDQDDFSESFIWHPAEICP